MGWLAAAAAAVAGLVFWRRNTLNEDVEMAKGAAMGAVAKVKNRGADAGDAEEADAAEPEAAEAESAADDAGDAAESDES